MAPWQRRGLRGRGSYAAVTEVGDRLLTEIAHLRETAAKTGVREGDPLWPLISAIGGVIGGLAELDAALPRQVERLVDSAHRIAAAAAVEAGGRTSEIEARAVAGAGQAVEKAVDRHMAASLGRWNARLAVTAAGGWLLLALAAGVGGWFVGRGEGRRLALDSAQAVAREAAAAGPEAEGRWLSLMRANPQIEAAVRSCVPLRGGEGDGSACAVPLWLAPAQAGARADVDAALRARR